MLSSDEGEDDLFFDSVDCLSSEEPVETKEGLGCDKLEYDIWLNEPQSVKERRQSFLRGLVEFASEGDEIIGLDRITESSGAVPSSSDSYTSGKEENLFSCGRETNSEAISLVDEMEIERLDEPSAACENENSGSSPSMSECELGKDKKIDAGKMKKNNWWKHILYKMKERKDKIESEVPKSNPEAPKTKRMKVKQNNKRCLEFTGVYMGQEIQAHKGLISTMKFSPDGQYLATGGEDGVVRIWRVSSVAASCKSVPCEDSFDCNLEKGKSNFGAKKRSPALVVIPEKVFQIEESPLQEFHGHASNILDLAWSNSNCLLSSSMDKTVRLWQMGCNCCLNVFRHSNYVTCSQFNPVDESYFISGSIDGKVRIWGVSEKRVVDWVDVRDVISAICYQPDGQGFVVGSITGSCRFYEVSGNELQLKANIHTIGRKKNSSNRITSIQFSEERSQRVMVTSEDSKLRIYDGVNIVKKFKGLPKSGSQMSASFTSTGRHIISVGEDSRVYVWNYDGLCTPSCKQIKSVRSCEHFCSEGVSVAVPWSGMGTELRGLGTFSPWNQVQTEEGASWRRDSDRFSLGSWFFMDGSRRGCSATWPEEKLPVLDVGITENEYQNRPHEDEQHRLIDTNDHTALSEAWGLVIVTAGWDGKIRTFQNYGLPIRL